MEPPEIPERRSSKNVLRLSRYSSLMSETTQASLKAKSTRTASIASDVSAMSADSTVSNFLERKIRLHKSSIEYIRSYQDGLREALMSDKLRPLQYEREMAELDEESEDTRHELQIFERQGRTLGLDIEEWYDSHATKRQKTSSEPSTEFMERAYGAVMVPRIMANAKQNRKFNKTKFRSEVIQFYNADGWCHISGGQDDKYIRAAHLVPKCLRGDELTHLFGAGEVVLSDPSNGEWAIIPYIPAQAAKVPLNQVSRSTRTLRSVSIVVNWSSFLSRLPAKVMRRNGNAFWSIKTSGIARTGDGPIFTKDARMGHL